MLSTSSLCNLALPLVLASGSSARRRMLEAAGLPFEIASPDLDERAIEASLPDRSPVYVALALARAKALAVSVEIPRALVIGADQALSLERRIFHKPLSREDALHTLVALSGRTHCLTSAFALAQGGQVLEADFDVAEMTMRALDEQTLGVYLDAADESVLDCVGGYQLEALGVHLFSRVKGDHSTVLGMPMLKLLSALRALGALRI